MKGIIMAGGEGSRLRPLTFDIPKPLVPVANKPAIKHIVEHLHKYGVGELAVTLFYLPHKIKDYLLEEYGDEIKFYTEEKPLGTAGSVKNAKDFLKETFIVMSGDVITDVNIKEVYDFHRKKGSKVTLVLKKVEIPLEYGVVIVDETGKIVKFLEKPSWGEVFSDTVNTGIYIIEPEILEFIPEDRPFDFSKDLFPLLLKENIPMYGYITEGYWCDIGNTAQYLSSHFDVLEGKLDLGYRKILLEEGKVIGKKVLMSSGAKLILPLIIGNEVVIEENAVVGPNVVIGRGTIIKKGSHVKNSVLWEDVYVGENSELNGAVVCNKVRIDSNARILENAVIGEGVRIKAFAEIRPDVKVWPFKVIEEEAVVSKDVVWGNGRKNLSFGYRGIRGIFNEEIGPYQAVEIGEAFGDLMKGKVIVGSDGELASSLIADLIAYGLAFSGCEVLKSNSFLLPALRVGIRLRSAKGGVYVEKIGEEIRILFLDGEGMDIDRNLEKKIENKLKIHDISRRKIEDIKPIKEVDVERDYKDYLVKDRADSYKIKVKPHDEWTKKVLLQIKGEQILDDQNYHLKVKLKKNGEEIELYDEKDRKFDEDEVNYLKMLIAREKGLKKVVLPFNSSKYLAEFAEELAVETVVGKISPRDLMRSMTNLEEGRQVYFDLSFDGINFLLEVIEYVRLKNKRLSEIKDSFPLRYKTVKRIRCDWKDKGRIIRELFETRKNNVTFLDGLRFEEDEGWVLVVPDSELPFCNVYVEALTPEKAERLFTIYEKKIQDILLKNDGK